MLDVGFACLALLLVATAFAGARHLPIAKDRAPLLPVRWPRRGQAALVVGNGRLAASPHEQRQGQSVPAVQAGEQLTERQLLEALLIASGNNIAQILAGQVAGSQTRFIAEINAEARALGMDHTIYTDPSGFDLSTVSVAADQLRVLQEAMRFPVFRQIVSMASVTLPVAGTVTNYDPLIAEGYAGKTGSDSAAGGCLAFFTSVTVGGRRLTAIGVVMGQGEGSDTSALLAAAGEAAEQLLDVPSSRRLAGAGPRTDVKCKSRPSGSKHE